MITGWMKKFKQADKTARRHSYSWLPKSWQQRWSKWIGRRLPPQPEVTLTHKGIFILPSRFGLAWIGLIILLYLFGTNYQNNLVIGMSLLLASLFHTCIIYSYKNLAGLSFKAQLSGDVYAGKPHAFAIMLTHDSQDNPTRHQQICLQFAKEQHTRLIHADEQTTALVNVSAPHRGILTPGRITVWSNFPLGLFRAWSYVDLGISQIVFASPKQTEIQLSGHYIEDEQAEHGKQRPGVDDYKGLKDYVPGESLKQVAWKQWAQDKGMLTKEFSEPEGQPVWLSLASCSGTDLEDKLSRLAYQVNTLSQKQQVFGLILGSQVIEQQSGEAHRLTCQKAISLFHPPIEAKDAV